MHSFFFLLRSKANFKDALLLLLLNIKDDTDDLKYYFMFVIFDWNIFFRYYYKEIMEICRAQKKGTTITIRKDRLEVVS